MELLFLDLELELEPQLMELELQLMELETLVDPELVLQPLELLEDMVAPPMVIKAAPHMEQETLVHHMDNLAALPALKPLLMDNLDHPASPPHIKGPLDNPDKLDKLVNLDNLDNLAAPHHHHTLTNPKNIE